MSSHIYSRYTHKAIDLLGALICSARKTRKMTAHEVAERAGISRTTLQKIERGSPVCEIGLVFEVAAIVGVPLFEGESSALDAHLARVRDKLTLLPQRIRQPEEPVDDDF